MVCAVLYVGKCICLYLFSFVYPLTVQTRCPGQTLAIWIICLRQFFVSCFVRDVSVVILHLPTGPLETRSELVPRCEPSTNQR